jgi:putative sigma-54 modulation protein
MRTQITGRHMELTPILRDYVQGKVVNLDRYFHNIIDIKVIFDSTRDTRFDVEVVVSLPRNNVFAIKSDGKNAIEAFDTALDKVERKLSNFKERVNWRLDKTTRRIVREIKRGENLNQ